MGLLLHHSLVYVLWLSLATVNAWTPLAVRNIPPRITTASHLSYRYDRTEPLSLPLRLSSSSSSSSLQLFRKKRSGDHDNHGDEGTPHKAGQAWQQGLLRRIPGIRHLIRNRRHHPHHYQSEAKPRSPSNMIPLARNLMATTMAVATSGVLVSSGGQNTLIPPASASAPVMALPKAEGRDPATEALMEHERRITVQTQKELQAMAATARRIEAEQGVEARIRYEKDYKEQQQLQAEARKEGLVQLKRDLLEQGICPFTDLEGQRQVILYERGVDLGEVQGTPFHLEKTFEQKNPKRSLMFKKTTHRKILQCMVQDLNNRGIDPLDYFEKRQEKTMQIMDLPEAKAIMLLDKFQTNMDLYGQITVPKEGEQSAKEKLALAQQQQQQQQQADPAAARELAKRQQAQQKAMEKEQRELAKKEAQAAKEAERARIKAEKEAIKASKDAEKNNAKAAAAAAAAAAASAASTTVGSAAAVLGSDAPPMGGEADSLMFATPTAVEQPENESWSESDGTPSAVETLPSASATPSKSKQRQSNLPIVPASAAFIALGGGGYAFKIYREKAARDEEERQRQFRLLMGEESKPKTPTIGAIDYTKIATRPTEESPAPASIEAEEQEEPIPEPEVSKKKRVGIKQVFGKKKSERETNLDALVGSDASTPKFASLLAKILTFGAPGRFPKVVNLPGGMPMTTFDLEEAKKLLYEEQQASNLSLEESAEVFANVVNCMLIDIVDLASTSLKEKDDDITVKSINIVVDFMNHAASLYDSIAKDVVIKPVTYGGTLSKSKLEQMFSTYTISGMMEMMGDGEDSDETSVPSDFNNRVALLQDVFQISEKKAEGLMMKAVQKNMMKMMKEGKGMEGMEKMLGNMGELGGLGGLGGLPGMEDGEGPSPEQLKEMLVTLKTMKESGQIPPSEFENVKKQFKEAFGSSLDDVVKDASQDNQLDENEKELLQLMKAIMDD